MPAERDVVALWRRCSLADQDLARQMLKWLAARHGHPPHGQPDDGMGQIIGIDRASGPVGHRSVWKNDAAKPWWN